MKRNALYVVITILLLSLVGCQNTPEENYVVQKSTELYANNQEATTLIDDEMAPLKVPSMYKGTIDTGNDAVTITIDARVIGDTSYSKVNTAYSLRLTQEMVDRVIAVLLPDATLYNPSQEMTKQELMQALEIMVKTQEENRLAGFDVSQSENEIATLREMLRNAPDYTDRTVNDGKFTYRSSTGTPRKEGDTATATPIVQQPSGNTDEKISAIANLGKMPMATFSAYSSESSNISYVRFYNIGKGYEQLQYVENDDDIPSLSTTYKEASDLALETVQEMGLNYLGVDVSLIDVITDPQDPSYKIHCYTFILTRRINDAKVSFVQPMLNFTIGEEQYAPPFPEEFSLIKIDDSGVIAFEWYCPTEIKNDEEKAVRLLTFENILDRFAVQMKVSAGWVEEGITSRDITIDKVRFGLAKVPTGRDTYSYVPVWDFLGYHVDRMGASDGEVVEYKGISQSYIVTVQ